VNQVYKQLVNTGNDEFRNYWVTSTLRGSIGSSPEPTLLDVGAGLCPYKAFAIDLGFQYRSHDFGGYIPEKSNHQMGLHSASWAYPEHDFQCDILDIPDSVHADYVLCTEVLEHVPDPIRVFEKLSKIVSSDGYLIITVPFSSLMHQAPYWFQAGLSPFWFEYWAKKFEIEIIELTVYGDYVDQMSQEVRRFFPFLRHLPGALKAISWLAKGYRRLLSNEVLTSGGFGVLFVGKRNLSG
jgi:SAM-dependent methyltransferase